MPDDQTTPAMTGRCPMGDPGAQCDGAVRIRQGDDTGVCTCCHTVINRQQWVDLLEPHLRAVPGLFVSVGWHA